MNPGFGPTVWSTETVPAPAPALLTGGVTSGNFRFPSGTVADAAVTLFTTRVENQTFWFGFAEFSPIPEGFPEGINGGSVRFDDGLGGLICFRDGSVNTPTRMRVGFVGLTGLVPTN